MAKLIRYRIIAAVQFFLVFFFMMLVFDYTQYDAKMFNARIDTIYENKYDYLDCRVSDFVVFDEKTEYSSLESDGYFGFYDHFMFDLDRNESADEIGYSTPTFCVKLPDEITWIEGSKPNSNSEIALGEDLYKIMKKYSSQPITIGSRITLKPVSLIKDSYFLPKEVTIKGVYSSNSTTLLLSDFKYQHLIADSSSGSTWCFVDDYNQFNESFYMWPFGTSPLYATPNNILIKVPKDRNILINKYKEDRHIRYCIDNFVTDNSYRYFSYKPIANIVNHQKDLVILMIVFGIIGAFALFLLFVFLFASTQLVIIRSEGKSLKDIFKKELLFYALILFGGGVVFTIYTLIFPWAFIIQPILISLLCFIGIITINWLLIFIWKYKELSKE